MATTLAKRRTIRLVLIVFQDSRCREFMPSKHIYSISGDYSIGPFAALGALGVRKRRLLLFGDGGKRGFNDAEAFVKLLFRNHQRHKNSNHVVERAGGDGNKTVFVAVLGDS